MKIVGEPFKVKGFLFFNCSDDVVRSADQLGAICEISGKGFYSRWYRMHREGHIDQERLFHKGPIKTGKKTPVKSLGTAEWQALTRPGKPVEDIPEPTMYENRYFPKREVQNEYTSKDINAAIEEHNTKVRGIYEIKHGFMLR